MGGGSPLTAGLVRVFVVDLDVVAPGEAVLGQDERDRAARVRNSVDRRRWIASRASLRTLLGELMAIDAATVRFEAEPDGKPAVRGGPEFSLAHSGPVALVAVASDRPVGVDVEFVRDDPDWPDVATRALPAAARAAVFAAAPGPARAAAFTRAWVRREAYVKARGAAMADPAEEPTAGWRVVDLPDAEAWFAAVAAPGRDWEFTLEAWP